MVNTFVVGTLSQTVSALTDKHLGKQRVEAKQIINAIRDKNKGWQNHPAVNMWRGYLPGLIEYHNACIEEWIRRGFENNMPLEKILETRTYTYERKTSEGEVETRPKDVYPFWFTQERLHQCHRSILCRKNPEYRSRFTKLKLTVDEEYFSYGYIWPSHLSEKDWSKPLAEITHPIADYLVEPRYCPELIKSGKNKGKPCGVILRKPADKFCGRHQKKTISSESESE